MTYIQSFSQIDKSSVSLAGGKGASLAEMTRAGIPVPAGFVLLTSAFDEFLLETDLKQEVEAQLNKVNHNEMESVQRASEIIQELILQKEIPKSIADQLHASFLDLDTDFVAVRSSATAEDGATASWAGELDSYLNTTKETLLNNVQKCWASLFTPRAIFYRFEKGFDGSHVSVAVVVQKMVNSDISGIAFSVHPITEDPNQMIIEAGWGLGESIVSGSITPDSYVIRKDQWSLIDINVASQKTGLFRKKDGGNELVDIPQKKSNQQKLNDKQIVELAQLIKTIENHYGFPVDVEWAMEDGAFSIVQSRPITTLSASNIDHQKREVNKEDWVFFYRMQGFPFLITDLWVKKYKGILGLHDGTTHIGFMLKSVVQSSLDEGFELFTNEEQFSTYEKSFQQLIAMVPTFIQRFNEEEITSGFWREYVDFTTQIAEHYEKMEWFFTDLLYEKSVGEDILERVEELKQSGRDAVNKMTLEDDFLLFIEKVAKKIGVSDDALYRSSTDAIQRALNGEKFVDPIERKKGFGLIWNGVGYDYLSAQEAAEITAIVDPVPKNTTSISGVVANPGIVRGKAAVIPNLYEELDKLMKLINEMPEGRILVASTTSPEYTPALAKASAVITNEGGLGSHAAIVTREMGIPCIVGTQNATEVIKDGDELEVDANKGVVKIIVG